MDVCSGLKLRGFEVDVLREADGDVYALEAKTRQYARYAFGYIHRGARHLHAWPSGMHEAHIGGGLLKCVARATWHGKIVVCVVHAKYVAKPDVHHKVFVCDNLHKRVWNARDAHQVRAQVGKWHAVPQLSRHTPAKPQERVRSVACSIRVRQCKACQRIAGMCVHDASGAGRGCDRLDECCALSV